MTNDEHHRKISDSIREVRTLLSQAGKDLTALAMRYELAVAELEKARDARCEALESEEDGDSVETHIRGYKADLITDNAVSLATVSHPRSPYRHPEELLKDAAWAIDVAIKHIASLNELKNNQAGP